MLFEVRVGMAIELKQHLLEFSEYLDKRIAEKKDVRSGYKDLDDIIGGFYGGKVYVVGARTGKGKTSFLTNIALNNSTSNKILVFSTEIGVNEFIERLIALSSDISVFSLRTQISELYDDIIFNRIDQLKQYNIFVNDSPNPGIGVICNEVKEVKPSLLIVDYLGQIFFKPTFPGLAVNILLISLACECSGIFSVLGREQDILPVPAPSDISECWIKLGCILSQSRYASMFPM